MNILVVDDNEADQFLSEFAIQQYDENIVINKAYDGQEALNFLEACDRQPELVLLDINMPGMNGFGFLEQYHQRFSEDASITVMLTSSIREDDYNRCTAYPYVKKVVAKPLNVDVIADCIKLYVTKH